MLLQDFEVAFVDHIYCEYLLYANCIYFWHLDKSELDLELGMVGCLEKYGAARYAS